MREWDEDLAEAVRLNTRRYVLLVSEALDELVPEYRERDAPARDALDVFISHRMLLEQRTRGAAAAASQSQATQAHQGQVSDAR